VDTSIYLPLGTALLPTTTGQFWPQTKYFLMNAIAGKVRVTKVSLYMAYNRLFIKVPVIIIFTKFDALITTARGALRNENRQMTLKESKLLAPARAEEKFNTIISLLKDRNYFRGNYVRLQGEPMFYN
jgi:hypothetical protein